MNRLQTILATAICGLLISSPALAVKPGAYLGASVGGATTDFSEANTSFDDTDTAWKIFAGYHFLQFFAVEGSYRDLGSVSDNGFTADTTGWDIAGLAGLPIGPVYLFGKIGAINWDADTNAGPNFDGTDFEVGIGASIDIVKVQLRAEVEYLDVLDGAVMYTVGGAWRF
jgi:hypothetical protein